MKIRYKLIAGYIIIALFTGLVGYLGSRQTVIIERELDKVSKRTLPNIRMIEDMKKGVLRIAVSTNESAFLTLLDTRKGSFAVDKQKEADLIAEGRDFLDAAIARYGLHDDNQLAADQQNFKLMTAGAASLFHSSDAIIKGVQNSASPAVLLILKEKFEKDEHALMHLIDKVFDLEYQKFKANKEQAEATIDRANHRITLFAVGTVLIAILSGIAFSMPISRRIQKLKEAVERFSKGEFDGIVAINSHDELDILATSFNDMATALRQSSNELTNSKNYLNDIIHSMLDALIVVTPEGTIKSVNVATCIMFGYETEVAGLPFSAIMPDSPLPELLEKGHLRDVERTCLATDGRELVVAFSGSVMWSADNQAEGFVCIAHDITERKKAEHKLQRYSEELRESNDELRSFAYIVSHDLRAPLVNIRGFAAELNGSINALRGVFDKTACQLEERERNIVSVAFGEDLPEALEFINSSVIRMDGLINAILKLSRIGHRNLKQQHLDVREMVQTLLRSMAHQLDQYKTNVVIGELPNIEADHIAMEQVFGNLIDNAVKYLEPTRTGSLEILGERGERETTFHIRDNGRGIDQVDLGKVFEIFRRAGRQDVQGEGMGLAYVKTLVRRFGGQIWCRSEPGVGSTFSFTVPHPESLHDLDIHADEGERLMKHQ